MLDEFALVPDIFDSTAYNNPAEIDYFLSSLRATLMSDALVCDLSDGGWREYCIENSGRLHRLCKEYVKKLIQQNRLRRRPQVASKVPTFASEWCAEAIATHGSDALTGIICSHATKLTIPGNRDVASVERMAFTPWWQDRKHSLILDRKTAAYALALGRVLAQANSLMFIDANLDPSSRNYQEFGQLLFPLAGRAIKPRIEIHRSFCMGDGRNRTFPTKQEWQIRFDPLRDALSSRGLSAEIYFWNDFHDRYLIADVIGLSVQAGFDVTTQPGANTTWARIDRGDKDMWQRKYDESANSSELHWRFSI